VTCVGLYRAFRSEQTDPDGFYSLLAEDSLDVVAAHTEISGRTVVDVGGGPGHFTAAFRMRGARCVLIEREPAELRAGFAGAVVADGYRLPIRDGGVDICFSSNVLEHVPEPGAFLDEMVRVTRPGGLIYLSYTVWHSPWGGHETAPWHYLGGHFAARRYARVHGRPPKNGFGTSLFPISVARVLPLINRQDARVLELRPRYYPRWCRFLVRIPVVRELLTWNLLVVLQRNA